MGRGRDHYFKFGFFSPPIQFTDDGVSTSFVFTFKNYYKYIMEDDFEDSILQAIKSSYPSKNKLAIILKDQDGMTQYCCVTCPKKYTEKEKLELHLCVHTKQYKHICGICGTGLKRKEHLDRHTLEHQEFRPHVCPQCGKAFKRKEHLNIHKAIHSGDKNLACTICGRSFYRKDHLQKHLQTHSKTFVEQNLQIGNDESLMDIKQEMTDDYMMPFINMNGDMEYEELEDSFNFNETLEPIVAIESKIEDDRPFGCHLCGKTYKRKDHLKLHIATHNRKEQPCSECGKVFYNTEKLFNHMKTHMQQYSAGNGSGSPTHAGRGDADLLIENTLDLLIEKPMNPQTTKADRPHECHICHRKFKRKQHLKVHGNVHQRQQATIWCSLCKEGFVSNHQFETHVCVVNQDGSENGDTTPANTTQEAKKENKYPSDCIQVVMDEGDQESSAMLVEEEQLPVPQRVFVCKYCSKPFKRKDHYKIHLHIHTGVKSFFCPECGKGFYRKDHLQKHVLVHTKSKPRPKRDLPDLYPISMLPKKSQVKPEITIHAPSNTKLRVPLQIKVPYQMVMSMDNGEQRAVTINPQTDSSQEEDM
ncbi:zinc finger protein 605-like isoform X2 [Galleria mellonella]|uniref:Zinc finger protein 605-like isoform X2 n=1 Tax=Galleria mellonella TaxID=7137 RepID=A0A6J3BZ64_GALME|nr:zinc finger protein 605-like isoform X2 [Galleria mellonella]